MGRRHLHRDDIPATLAILAALLDHRSQLPAGYQRTDVGAWVDWDQLAGSWLSTTETAVVHIARGCAIAERVGGMPAKVTFAVSEAMAAIGVGAPPTDATAGGRTRAATATVQAVDKAGVDGGSAL